MMLSHHIKVAVRSIRNQGFFALLNVIGLAVGLVLGLFVLLLVKNELSYDTSFSNSNRIHRVATKGIVGSNIINSATTPMPLHDILSEVEEVEEAVRFITGANNVVSNEGVQFNEDGFLFGQSNFFNVFDVKIIESQRETLLNDPRSVVITQSTARKYFAGEDALGQTLARDGIDYLITGVCEDVPATTHFNFDFVASLSTIDEIILQKGDTAYLQNWKSDWLYLNCYTYLKLKPDVNVNAFETKLNDLKDKAIQPIVEAVMTSEFADDSISLDFFAQNIEGIHFNSHLDGELDANSNPIYIKLFVFVAVFILLISCINFINLTTAKLRNKYKEVGYRQMVGASRGQLIAQFLVEAIIYCLGAMFIGMVLLELLLPILNSFFDLDLQFNFFQGWVDFFGILLLVLVVGFFSGSFPAFFFSSKKPERLIAGEYKISKAGFIIRGVLVASQFGVVMFLFLIGSSMWVQMSFIEKNNPGFDADNIIVVDRGSAVNENFDQFKSDLLKVKGVELVSACSNLPGDDYYHGTFRVNSNGSDHVVMLPMNYVEGDFFELLGLKLKQGRFLDLSLGDTLSMNMNNEAVKRLHISKPLDSNIEIVGKKGWELSTVGVLKDFHFEPYYEEIKPLVLVLLSGNMRFEYVLIKADNGATLDMNRISQIWSKYSNGAPFVYQGLDARIDRLYEQDIRIMKIMMVFAFLSLFIAILGVVALVAFIIEYKSESIAVKKIIGAPRQLIMRKVFSMFGVYVVIGVVAAILPAYAAIKAWGETYAYFKELPIGVYFLGAIVLTALSFFVAFLQTFRGASNSPVRNT